MAVEDFTTYTESDPHTRATITATKIDVNAIDRDEECRVYSDKGVAHFVATFEHDVDLTLTVKGAGYAGLYNLSNVIDDINAWATNDDEAFTIRFHSSKDTWEIKEWELDDLDDSNFAPVQGTKYYFTVERTGETDVQVRIYSDGARTVLVDTIAITITNGRRYRYMFAFCGNDDASAGGEAESCDVENLDLNEAIVGNPWYAYAQQTA